MGDLSSSCGRGRFHPRINSEVQPLDLENLERMLKLAGSVIGG